MSAEGHRISNIDAFLSGVEVSVAGVEFLTLCHYPLGVGYRARMRTALGGTVYLYQILTEIIRKWQGLLKRIALKEKITGGRRQMAQEGKIGRTGEQSPRVPRLAGFPTAPVRLKGVQ